MSNYGKHVRGTKFSLQFIKGWAMQSISEYNTVNTKVDRAEEQWTAKRKFMTMSKVKINTYTVYTQTTVNSQGQL